MIDMLLSRYQNGDFFAGRMSLFGKFGTLWPCGVKPLGQAVTFGMPGSGKSTAVAIPAVLLHDGPVFCFDPKGEIARACYAARGSGGNGVKGRGDKVCVVDPANLTGLPKARYNPLQEITRQNNSDKALLLLENLVAGLIKSPGGENEWVYTEARGFLKALIAYVMTNYPPEDRTLATVRRLLMEGDRAAHKAAKDAGKLKPGVSAFDALLAKMQGAANQPNYGHIIAGEAGMLLEMGDRQYGAVLSAAKDATRWLDLPRFKKATETCDFFLSDFQTKRISVFVCLPLPDLKIAASGFMRLFLTMFTDLMFRAPHLPKAGTVLCLVDEFPAFGNIDGFCVIGPQMRSYGVKLHCLMQDLGQLKAVYPKEWEGFIGCAAMVVYCAMKHGETLEYLVKSLGERITRERQPDGRVIERIYPLLDREQAGRYLAIGKENMIVVRYDKRPLRLKTAPYFRYLPFWRYSPDPQHREPALRAWMRQRAVTRAVGKKVERRRENAIA